MEGGSPVGFFILFSRRRSVNWMSRDCVRGVAGLGRRRRAHGLRTRTASRMRTDQKKRFEGVSGDRPGQQEEAPQGTRYAVSRTMDCGWGRAGRPALALG